MNSILENIICPKLTYKELYHLYNLKRQSDLRRGKSYNNVQHFGDEIIRRHVQLDSTLSSKINNKEAYLLEHFENITESLYALNFNDLQNSKHILQELMDLQFMLEYINSTLEPRAETIAPLLKDVYINMKNRIIYYLKPKKQPSIDAQKLSDAFA